MPILKVWNISNFKSDILMHVSSSTPFLYNKREPKYKENNIGHQISKHKIVQYLKCLKSDIPFYFAYNSAP